VTDHSNREGAGSGTDLSPLAREAIAWLLRLTSGEATAHDADQFRRWHAQDPAHAAAWKEAVRLWRALGPALSELQPQEDRQSGEVARSAGLQPSLRPKLI
jgi:transmembrane sensor